MRALVLLVAGLGALALSGARTPARADTSLDMRIDVGGVIGHGPLAERLDPAVRVGGAATLAYGTWMLDGGLVFLAGRGGSTPPMTAARGAAVAGPDLDAIGWSAGVRRQLATTPIGAGYVGAGYAVMALTSSQADGARVGRLQGPKLTAGLDFTINARGRRAGFGLGATYQWLVATFDGGGRSHGGYAGLELTIIQGFGTCHGGTSWSCGQHY